MEKNMHESIQQNQVIAIEKGAKNRAKDTLTEFYKMLQKPTLFNGKIKKFEKINDESPDIPDDEVKVQVQADKILEKVSEALVNYFDVTATKDWGNCLAKADIIIDGSPLIKEVPVTYLLFLEKELVDLRTFISTIPTLETSHDWNRDENSSLFKSNPVKTQRTAKVQKPIVLYDATDKHPAQTQLITEDVVVGYWNTIELSGAMPVPVKEKLVKKVEKILTAVKSAREKGNSVEVSKQEVGEKILSYILS